MRKMIQNHKRINMLKSINLQLHELLLLIYYVYFDNTRIYIQIINKK